MYFSTCYTLQIMGANQHNRKTKHIQARVNNRIIYSWYKWYTKYNNYAQRDLENGHRMSRKHLLLNEQPCLQVADNDKCK